MPMGHIVLKQSGASLSELLRSGGGRGTGIQLSPRIPAQILELLRVYRGSRLVTLLPT